MQETDLGERKGGRGARVHPPPLEQAAPVLLGDRAAQAELSGASNGAEVQRPAAPDDKASD